MDQLRKVFVQGGEVVVVDSPAKLITIVGSCVTVCLWDRVAKIGGMNHFLLPESGANRTVGGVTATKMLIQSMIKRMSSLGNLEAKIFGGANKFFVNNFLVVGPKNVEAAKKVLAEVRIPIVCSDTGGEEGRKIHFNTQTGEVEVSLI